MRADKALLQSDISMPSYLYSTLQFWIFNYTPNHLLNKQFRCYFGSLVFISPALAEWNRLYQWWKCGNIGLI